MARALPRTVRSFVTATVGAVIAVGLIASCRLQTTSLADCDYVVTRCRTVCDYYCDSWGCYPSCYDYCFNDCYITPRAPEAPTPTDAAASQPNQADAGAPSSTAAGRGVLCSPCTSTDDCHSGSLCIVRGSDAGASAAGFCGHPCTTSAECPASFVCTAIKGHGQCLPTGDRCE